MEKEQVCRLIEENLKTIYAYSLSRVSHKEDAEDLAGDIVLAILQSAGSLRDDRTFFGFVWAVAANTYKKFLRKRKGLDHDELDENTPAAGAVEDEFLREEELNRLRRELSILSKEHRECTIAYYIDGLSCAETAERLHLSLEMVKYYLFKTRKILKEGISMERQFGEKSYHPAKFELVTIFSGKFNKEYKNLFNRKLPGNILVSAYYTPMTIRELSVELGVAAVYLEDELDLLMKYGLLTALPGGKYQTKLVIFTESFTDEFHRTAEEKFSESLAGLLNNARKKLPALRKIGFTGTSYDDNRLLWAFLFDLMSRGNSLFEDTHPKAERNSPLYSGATGTNYGVDYETQQDDCSCYSCGSFAGYAGLDKGRYAVFADFDVLPKETHFKREPAYLEHCVTITEEEREKIEEILAEEIRGIAALYDDLAKCAAEIMRAHAPKCIEDMVDSVIEQTVFFRTVGLFGAMAVHSGALVLPEENLPAAVMLCLASEKTTVQVDRDCMMV